jgi:hypothetical protein
MLDYQTKGYGSHGASLGRRNTLSLDYAGEVMLRRVPLDEGGYDPGGAYWGGGSPLFYVFTASGNGFYVRARNPTTAMKAFSHAKLVPLPEEVNLADINDMVEAYITCALWSSTDEDGEPLDDNYDVEDIEEKTREKMAADCKAFAQANVAVLIKSMNERPLCDWSQAGHDFWLSRNGLGGFNDGDWPEGAGELLQEAAKKFPEVYFYAGDNGKIDGG